MVCPPSDVCRVRRGVKLRELYAHSSDEFCGDHLPRQSAGLSLVAIGLEGETKSIQCLIPSCPPRPMRCIVCNVMTHVAMCMHIVAILRQQFLIVFSVDLGA